jgi:hypothetical protein
MEQTGALGLDRSNETPGRAGRPGDHLWQGRRHGTAVAVATRKGGRSFGATGLEPEREEPDDARDDSSA